MIFYLLYRMGYFLAVHIPVRVSYFVAHILADTWYFFSRADRTAIVENLKVVLNDPDEKKLCGMAREVFRNFAKYLVEFFRFSKADINYINRFIKIEGLGNIDKARARGKGVIALSAHIGNWELGGFILAAVLRQPISAVVLTHQNKRINDFFTSQRLIGNMQPIEIGISLRACYRVLKDNGLLALLGDRDFSKNGLHIEFFGRKTAMPRGPAALSHKLGSAIVPCFMIRQADDTFRLIMEEPIFPDPDAGEEAAIENLARRYISIIESQVRANPTQWYIFRKVWNDDGKDMRPDTII